LHSSVVETVWVLLEELCLLAGLGLTCNQQVEMLATVSFPKHKFVFFVLNQTDLLDEGLELLVEEQVETSQGAKGNRLAREQPVVLVEQTLPKEFDIDGQKPPLSVDEDILGMLLLLQIPQQQ
jgi:hypothetical protein